MTIPIPNYAAQLQGLTLPGGWTVVQQLTRKPSATGGAFSSPYIVQDENGHKAFLKAIDLSTPAVVDDLAAHLERTLRSFRYERDLVTMCGQAKMDRIVRVVESGQLYVEPGNASSVVFFLVFEIADGDVHSVLDFARGVDVRMTMRTLHEISIALTQLHQRMIAHQDVKPSNVIMFSEVGSKLGDLGRASTQGIMIDHDLAQWAGDSKYSPPELLYGFVSDNWTVRRFGCDAYMFGALAVFLLTATCVSNEIQARLPAEVRRGAFGGAYSDLLPFLRQVTNELLIEVEKQVPLVIRSGTMAMLRALLDPDPATRGHPQQRRIKHGNPYALHRYTTELDILRKKADAEFLRARKSA